MCKAEFIAVQIEKVQICTNLTLRIETYSWINDIHFLRTLAQTMNRCYTLPVKMGDFEMYLQSWSCQV